MEERVHFAEKHPYAFAIVLIITFIAVQLIVGVVMNSLGMADVRLIYLISDIILFFIAVVILWRKQWWVAIGFRKPQKYRHFLFFLIPLIPVGVNLSGGVKGVAFPDIAVFFLLALLVGLVEEAYFRGLILLPIAMRGKWKAAIFTAVIFGMLHSLNIVTGFNPMAVFVQMGYALAIGFTYSALVLRTGMIWPLMIIHFLMDFAGFIAIGQLMLPETSTLGLAVAGIYIIVFLGYGIWILASGRNILLVEQLKYHPTSPGRTGITSI